MPRRSAQTTFTITGGIVPAGSLKPNSASPTYRTTLDARMVSARLALGRLVLRVEDGQKMSMALDVDNEDDEEGCEPTGE